jgi:hypothetical protein
MIGFAVFAWCRYAGAPDLINLAFGMLFTVISVLSVTNTIIYALDVRQKRAAVKEMRSVIQKCQEKLRGQNIEECDTP